MIVMKLKKKLHDSFNHLCIKLLKKTLQTLSSNHTFRVFDLDWVKQDLSCLPSYGEKH